MFVRHADASRHRVRRHTAAVASLLALGVVTAGCSAQTDDQGTSQAGYGKASAGSSPSASEPAASQATVAKNVADQGVRVDKVVRLSAKDGTFERVTVRAAKKALPGTLSEDKKTWTSKARLEPSTRYRVQAVAVDGDGVKATRRASFLTQTLSLDQQTYPSFAPVEKSTVGVGMPVVIRFDVPVRNKASFEKHLTVTNSSGQQGAWNWISDSEVHWRPVKYWKPGTDVTVKADVNSISAGNGVYGQLSRSSTFHVGNSVISRVNAQTHQMKTFVNGRLAKTTPITTGKPGFITRSGVKVIVEKFRHKRMNSETVGIAAGSSEAYDLNDVEYAMRVTNSGEFLHAAPWSVGSQGYANVSHGCTGMSTASAAWLYNISKPGDVVDYTGTDRPMTLDNGYGDWNESFAQWKQGSALS